MPKADQKQNHIIATAALRLVAARGWKHVTLEQIAKAAKIPVAQIKKRFSDTHAVLPLIVDVISAEAFAACGKPSRAASMHDRLFDVLMARFERLQAHRKVILSIADAARSDSRMALALILAQIKAMQETQKFCEPKKKNMCASVTSIFLWGIYTTVFRTWQADETIDMARTMAALDRALRYAGKAATLLRVDFGQM
jgi:AcrR family transcriptional regulator